MRQRLEASSSLVANQILRKNPRGDALKAILVRKGMDVIPKGHDNLALSTQDPGLCQCVTHTHGALPFKPQNHTHPRTTAFTPCLRARANPRHRARKLSAWAATCRWRGT
eukprot:353529-Chlamydomonas_euryale.AAC.2